MHICEYCKTCFKSKYTLANHQNTAKYCLGKRGIVNEDFECNFCGSFLSTKLVLESHLTVCTEKQKYDTEKIIENIRNKYEEQISVLVKEHNEKINIFEEKISFLEKALEDSQNTIKIIALENSKRPINITTNNKTRTNIGNKYKIDHLKQLKDSDFTESVQYYTKTHALRGVDGMIDYAMTYILDGRVESIDVSRKKILYLDEKNKVVIDDMNELIKKIIAPLESVHTKIIKEHLENSREDILEYADIFDYMIKYHNELYGTVKCSERNISLEKITSRLVKKVKRSEMND